MQWFSVPKERAQGLNPLVLAYAGDSVCALYVRGGQIAASDKKAGPLHNESKRYLSAAGQAARYDAIKEALTDEEKDICRRARNTHTATVPKNTDLETYKKATSLEALVGFHYLAGNAERLNEILKAAYPEL